MEEMNWLHIVTQHPIIAFLIGALIVMALLVLIFKLAARFFSTELPQRKRKNNINEFRDH